MPFAKPYLLFDAGGTLVFPDQAFIIALAQVQGITLTHDQLFSAYCQLIYDLDCRARAEESSPSPWPRGYIPALLEKLGVAEPAALAIAAASRARPPQKSLWAYSFQWVAGVLDHLARQGYRMSVISNSDGRAEETLVTTELAGYLERVFDSDRLGVAKPDPAIFEIALAELDLSPAEALYIGDVYYLDVAGANRAGLGCIHLDPVGLYRDWPGVHLPDLRHLPEWLVAYAAEPARFDLRPLSR